MNSRNRTYLTLLSAALLVFALTFGLGAPPLASAADAGGPPTDVWGEGGVSISDLKRGMDPTYVVTLQLKESVTVPTQGKVGIAIPEDCQVLWAGVLMGESGATDVIAEDLEVIQKDGYQIAAFTMTTGQVAQVECTVPKGMIAGEGDSRTIDLRWKTPSECGPIQMAIIAPTGFKAEDVPREVQAYPAIGGGAAYVKNFARVEPLREIAFELTLVPGEPELTATTTETPSAESTLDVELTDLPGGGFSMTPTMWVLAGLGLAIVAAIIALVVSVRRGNAVVNDAVADAGGELEESKAPDEAAAAPDAAEDAAADDPDADRDPDSE